MIKYAKIVNEEKKSCIVGLGSDSEYYEAQGMSEMDVEQAFNGIWYLAGYAPEPPTPEPKTIFKQAEIVEAFAEAEKMDILEGLLDNKTFNIYWVSMEHIDINHPITANAIQQLDEADNGISSQEIIDIINCEI